MKVSMRNILVLFIMVIIFTIPACSKESLKRTGYKTLQNVQEHKCQKYPGAECPESESYEDYERQRRELESYR